MESRQEKKGFGGIVIKVNNARLGQITNPRDLLEKRFNKKTYGN